MEALAIIFGSLLIAMGIIAWTFVNLFGREGRRSGMDYDEESQMIQEMYHGFQKMESRIESLETLLLERERKG